MGKNYESLPVKGIFTRDFYTSRIEKPEYPYSRQNTPISY
jgi:hypothetical protein